MITLPEFRQALKRLGMGLSASKAGAIFRRLDADNEGTLDIQAFLRWARGDGSVLGETRDVECALHSNKPGNTRLR